MNIYSINVLIVDDDNDDAEMLADAIQYNLPSCNCTFIKDGLATLKYIKSNVPPDLVFLDLNMPIKKGIDCLKDITKENLLPDSPIVIYSTSISMSDIDNAYKLGASFYIVKPATDRKLREVVKQAMKILGKPKSERVDKINFVLGDGIGEKGLAF